MAAQNFRRFRTKNGKLFAFFSLYRIKNTIKKLPQIVFRLANDFLYLKWLKIYIFKKIIGRKKNENINKIEKY
jgi:hypothetical protein